MVTNTAGRRWSKTHAGFLKRVHANQCSAIDNKPMIRYTENDR